MDALDDDLVLRFARYLRSGDLLHLALACRRFGHRRDAVSARAEEDAKRRRIGVRAGTGAREGTTWSLVDEAARTILANSQSAAERELFPKSEERTWLGSLRELEMHRTPLTFDQLFGEDAELAETAEGTERKSEALIGSPTDGRDYAEPRIYNGAICDQVMRSGRHYASFTCSGPSMQELSVGIMRPVVGMGRRIYETEDFHPMHPHNAKWLEDIYDKNTGWNCYLYQLDNGAISHCSSNVTGRVGGFPFPLHFSDTERVDMVLDLDEGSLAVYRNGSLEWEHTRYDYPSPEIAGDFCWVAVKTGFQGRVCIERGQRPLNQPRCD